jgi:hypothetical protein
VVEALIGRTACGHGLGMLCSNFGVSYIVMCGWCFRDVCLFVAHECMAVVTV